MNPPEQHPSIRARGERSEAEQELAETGTMGIGYNQGTTEAMSGQLTVTNPDGPRDEDAATERRRRDDVRRQTL